MYVLSILVVGMNPQASVYLNHYRIKIKECICMCVFNHFPCERTR